MSYYFLLLNVFDLNAFENNVLLIGAKGIRGGGSKHGPLLLPILQGPIPYKTGA
jgi:hypothetical protein